jgi:flagellar protein FliO/FliZ
VQRVHTLMQGAPRWRDMLLFAVLLCWIIGGIQVPTSPAAEHRAASHTTEKKPQGVKVQERFLHHFISSTLAQNTSPKDAVAAPQPVTSSALPGSRDLTTATAGPTYQLSSELTTTMMTMILALGGVLCLLGVGTYVIRRYLLKPNLLAKRGNLLRVLARINLTPKAAVALLEVPGKLLVIGVTGSTLTALGTLDAAEINSNDTEAQTVSTSFAATLEQYDQTPDGHEPHDDPLLQVPEHIQRKVSRLKQL